MAELSLQEAIGQGLREALDQDDAVFLLGDNIGAYGGANGVTRGFLEEYGPERIRDTPTAPSVIVGTAVGAAMVGLKPIVEIPSINLTLTAMDQIVNNLAKLRYLSNGQLTIPVVIRTVTGGGGQLGPQHSQSFESWFASVPGLKVVVPSTPYDALGLLRTAIHDENPIIFVEHSSLYGARGEVPDEWYDLPFGSSAVKRKGDYITFIAYSKMVGVALAAAEAIAADTGRESEVVDLRTLRPMDTKTVLDSVKKTGRAVVVEERWKTGGFAAEIASIVQEVAFDYLDGPVVRVGGLDVPTPYAGQLEAAVVPNVDRVVEAIEENFALR